MARRKTKTTDPLQALVAEAKQFEAERRSGTTLAKSRKSREKKMALRLLTKKVQDEHFKARDGALRKTEIQATIVIDHCNTCTHTTERVLALEVWGEATIGTKQFPEKISDINGAGAYDFYRHLPIKIVRTVDNWHARCPECLRTDIRSQSLPGSIHRRAFGHKNR